MAQYRSVFGCRLLTTVENQSRNDGPKLDHPTKIEWVISMEDWALISHLYHSEKLSKCAIATKLGIARDTVTDALTSEGPPSKKPKKEPSQHPHPARHHAGTQNAGAPHTPTTTPGTCHHRRSNPKH